MTIHKGRVNCRKLRETLHVMLLHEGYTELSSQVATDGYVYKSPSINNEDLFYIRIRDLNNHYLEVGIYESYTPNPIGGTSGSFGRGFFSGSMIWSTASNSDKYDVDYVIHVTPKHLMVYLNPMAIQPGRTPSIVYLGLPKRLDPNDKDRLFAGITGSINTHTSHAHSFYTLGDLEKNGTSYYNLDFYQPNRAKGWGDELFISPLFVTKGYEGFRGVLDGLYVLKKLDKSYEGLEGDTFIKDGKTYQIISPVGHNYTLLYQSLYDYAIEI